MPEVVVAQPQQRDAHHHGEKRRRQAAGDHRHEKGRLRVPDPVEGRLQDEEHLLLLRGQDQDGADIGADGHEPCMP